MAAQLYINPKFAIPHPQIGRAFSADDDGTYEQSLDYFPNVTDQSKAAYPCWDIMQHRPPNGRNETSSKSSSRNVGETVADTKSVTRVSGTRPASDLTGLRLSPFHANTASSPYGSAPVEMGYSTFPRMHAKHARIFVPGEAVGSPAYYADIPSAKQIAAQPHFIGVNRKFDNQHSGIPSTRSANNLQSNIRLQQTTTKPSLQQSRQPQKVYLTSSPGGDAAPPVFVYPRKIEELRGEMIDTTITKRDTGLGVTIIGGENGEPLQVKSIVPNSAADIDGVLQPGDLLVFISGMNVLDFTHDAVIGIFKSIQIGQKVRIIACRGYPLFTDDSEAPTEYIREFAGVEVGGGDAMAALQNPLRAASAARSNTTGHYLDENKVLIANGSVPSLIAADKAERTVTIRKGSIGFGFTIEHSNSTGYQKIKKIGDKNRCGELREGDLLIQINGQRLNTYSHSDIVNVLKRYPQHKEAVFHILRPLSKQKQQQQQQQKQQQAAVQRRGPSTSPSRARSKSASNSNVATPSHAAADGGGGGGGTTEDSGKHSFLGSLFGKHRRSQRSKADEQSAGSSVPHPHQCSESAVSPADSTTNGTAPAGDAGGGGVGSETTTPMHARSASSGNASSTTNFGRNQNAYSSFARIVTPCFVPASHYAATTTSPMSQTSNAAQQQQDEPSAGFLPQQHNRQHQQQHAEEPVVTSTTLMMPPVMPSSLSNGRRRIPAAADAGARAAPPHAQQRPQPPPPQAVQDMYAQVAMTRTPNAQEQRLPTNHQQQQQPLPSILRNRPPVENAPYYEAVQPTDPRPRFIDNAQDKHDYDEDELIAADDEDENGDGDDDDDAEFDAVTDAENVFVSAAAAEHPSATLGFELQILLKRDDNGFGFRVVGGNEENTQVSVGYIVPNGAAQQDGRLQTGDEILSVDGESTIGASHQHTVSVIRRAAENGFILLGILRRFESAAEAEAIVLLALNNNKAQQQMRHHHHESVQPTAAAAAAKVSPEKIIMPDVAIISPQQQQQSNNNNNFVQQQSRPKPQQQQQQQPPLMNIMEINLVRGTDEGFGFVLVSSMANSNNSNNAATNIASFEDDDDNADDDTDTTLEEMMEQQRAPSARYLNACPVIGRILPNSPAHRCEAFHVGDRLLRVNGIDIYNYQHKDIVNIIKNSGNAVTLTIASTPPPAYRTHADHAVSNMDSSNLVMRSPNSRFAVRQQQQQSSINNNLGQQHQHQRRNQSQMQPESPPSVQSNASTTASVSTINSSTNSNATAMTLSNSEDSHTTTSSLPTTIAQQQRNLSTPLAATRQPHDAVAAAAHLPRSNTVPIQAEAVMHHHHLADAFRGAGSVVRERGIDLPADLVAAAEHSMSNPITTGAAGRSHPVLLNNKSVYNVAYLSVELPKGPRGFGFSIRGGKEFESMPLFILKIADEGPAAESNLLRVGDEIVEINGVNTRNLTHAEAINLIKDGGSAVKLLLKRPRRVGSLVGGDTATGNTNVKGGTADVK